MRPGTGPLLESLIGAGLGAAVVLLIATLRRSPVLQPRPPGRLRLALVGLRSPATGGRAGLALLAGALALVVTRWPVAAIGVAALVAAWPQMFGGTRAERAQILTLEALVMWTETLRDTVSARASLEQAIPATVTHAAAPIRPALVRLTGRLRARVPLDAALLELSGELHDASADKVIGALVLNTRQRGTGLAAVLSALATAGRAELDQRRRVSAGRASMRRSVQLVVAITVFFAVFLAAFARDYVAPYSTLSGQVALIVVIGLFAAGFIWLRRLAGGESATPFLTPPDAKDTAADLRIVHHLTGITASTQPTGAAPAASARAGARR